MVATTHLTPGKHGQTLDYTVGLAKSTGNTQGCNGSLGVDISLHNAINM